MVDARNIQGWPLGTILLILGQKYSTKNCVNKSTLGIETQKQSFVNLLVYSRHLRRDIMTELLTHNRNFPWPV
jgi:hypothetical protein